MKIFRLFGLRNPVALRPKRPDTFGSLDDLLGSGPLFGRWDGLEMERIGNGPLGSMPYLTTSVLVVEQSQSEAVVDVLDDYGEWLAGSCEGVPYLVFNPTVLLDALDEANSEWLYENDDPDPAERICIMQQAFVADRVTAPVFRCLRTTTTMFFDGEIVNSLVGVGFKRSNFSEMWDSETGVVRE